MVVGRAFIVLGRAFIVGRDLAKEEKMFPELAYFYKGQNMKKRAIAQPNFSYATCIRSQLPSIILVLFFRRASFP